MYVYIEYKSGPISLKPIIRQTTPLLQQLFWSGLDSQVHYLINHRFSDKKMNNRFDNKLKIFIYNNVLSSLSLRKQTNQAIYDLYMIFI